MAKDSHEREEQAAADDDVRSDGGGTADVGASDGAGSEQPPPRPRRVFRLYDVAASAVFIVLWLAPISYVGMTRSDVTFFPNYLKNLHRCACLFTEKIGH